MTYATYQPKKFNKANQRLIDIADDICKEYMAAGYTLTLRQLYYQFVARGHIPNSQKEYKNLGATLNNARLAGLINWEAIEDRTRNLEKLPMWKSPKDILLSCAEQFRYDRWSNQDYRLEVWIEKEALVGVVEPVCEDYHVPYFACRGYTSQSEAWRAGQRFKEYDFNGQSIVILHLGDHDPSGIDMTRDNRERLELFSEGAHIEVIRLGLNWDQVQKYKPPPNPAKMTDTRADGYVKKFGKQSWELDALDPKVIGDLVRVQIEAHIDDVRWEASEKKDANARTRIQRVAERWKE